MRVPDRVLEDAGRYALVDGIPFHLPVKCKDAPALFAVFSIDADKAKALFPGRELHPFRLWNRGLLVITVIDYRDTTIGKYIEFSIAIACTHGRKPAPRFLPAIFMSHYDLGQYVLDLPVSTEISVKGGRGIWGMPKTQASLNFVIGERTVSSQYDKDGMLALKVEIERPAACRWPISAGVANFSSFRGMLMKSLLYFKGKVGFTLKKKGAARLTIGDHPRVAALHGLDISPEPIATAFIPAANGYLDDHAETWFLSFPEAPSVRPEGMETVQNLGLSQEWPPPPSAPVPGPPSGT
ncbi:MAG TPA: acetoacetate decarboxylase family protein [Polyangia bacterium]|jgi:hypothetical protein|nr:acetoacetate decarboxylase family protein [Polyangia bacterium]